MIQSRVVVPKNHFFLVFNRSERFFHSTVFHESSCGTPFFNEYGRVFAFINSIYKMYFTYFYLRRILISKEHLQVLLLEYLVSPKSCSFGVLLTLMFFRGTDVFGSSYFLEDLFEASSFRKRSKFFSKHRFQSSFF